MFKFFFYYRTKCCGLFSSRLIPFFSSTSEMAHGVSAVVSLVLALSVFAAMQAFRTQLASSQLMTILGGFLGSNIFVFLITVSLILP